MAPPALATMIPPKAQTGTSNSNPQPNCATGRGGPPGLAPSFPLRTAARPVRNRISRITGPAREVTANMPSVNSVESFIAYPLDVPDPDRARRCADRRTDSGCRSAKGRYSNPLPRSEEHTSELQTLMRISYATFCLKTKKTQPLTDVTQNTY